MRPSRVKRALGACALVAVAALATGCRALLRYPVAQLPSPSVAERRAREGMNPYVLTGLVFPQLVVEVDAVEGYEPAPRALAALEKLVRRYVEPGREFAIVRDDTIPRAEWEALKSKNDVRPLVTAHLDRTPDLEAGREVLYVLYVPGVETELFGFATRWELDRGGAPVVVDGIVMCTDTFRRRKVLWIDAAKIDQSTLLHEFGHLLGLVSNPAHVQRGNPRHCTSAECVMTHPRWRSILYNLPRGLFTGRLPWDYCRACRADIERARADWRERAAREPDFVSTLRDGRRAATLLAAARMDFVAGDADEGTTLAQAAIAAAPHDPQVAGSAAFWLDRGGDTAGAEDAYRRVIAFDPGSGFRWEYARFLAARGRYAEVLEVTDAGAVAREAGDDASDYGLWTASGRAQALWALGRRREAAACWLDLARAKEAPPYRRYIAAINAAALLRRQGDLAGAERALETGPKPERTRRQAYSLELARLRRAQGRDVEASRILDGVIAEWDREVAKARGDGATWAHYEKACALALAHRPDEVRGALAKAWPQPVKSAFTSYERAALLASAGAHAEALDLLPAIDKAEMGRIGLDPCVDERFDGVRATEAFRANLPQCPESSVPSGPRSAPR